MYIYTVCTYRIVCFAYQSLWTMNQDFRSQHYKHNICTTHNNSSVSYNSLVDFGDSPGSLAL